MEVLSELFHYTKIVVVVLQMSSLYTYSYLYSVSRIIKHKVNIELIVSV
jgi:hypothetical protein